MFKLRCALIGDTKSGKTALYNRLAKNEFSNKYESTHAVFHDAVNIDESSAIEFYESSTEKLHDRFYDPIQFQCVLFCINQVSMPDEKNIKKILKQIKEKHPHIPIILVGTYDDVSQKIMGKSELEKLKLRLLFDNLHVTDLHIVSAKENTGIEKLVRQLVDISTILKHKYDNDHNLYFDFLDENDKKIFEKNIDTINFQFELEAFRSVTCHLPVDQRQALGKSVFHLVKNLNDTMSSFPDKAAFVENFRNECTDILEGALPWRIAKIIGKIAAVIVATVAGLLLGSILGLLIGVGVEICLGGIGAGTVGASIVVLGIMAATALPLTLLPQLLFSDSIEMNQVKHFANMAEILQPDDFKYSPKSIPEKFQFIKHTKTEPIEINSMVFKP